MGAKIIACGRFRVVTVVLGSTLLLTGCAIQEASDLLERSPRDAVRPAAFPGLAPGDLTARPQGPRFSYGTVSGRPEHDSRIYPGTDSPAALASAAASSSVETVASVSEAIPGSTGRSYQLNFEATDVATVCRTILGEILRVNYLVDPRVTGQVNLSSTRAVPRESLTGLLEASLASINASLVRDGALYRVVPTSDPRGLGNVAYHSAEEGFGTTVIPIKYVPAATIAKVLEGLGTRAGSIKLESATNLVLVQGSAAERRAVVDAATLVDVDWMRTRSVAILPVEHASPETIISEINRILDTGEGGLSQNAVQLQPISRLHAVLAVSRRRDVIDHVTRWVMRLDAADYAAAGMKLYRLKFAQAKTVAATLSAMFSDRQSSTSGQSDGDQLEPGLESMEMSSPAKSGSSASSNSTSSGTQPSAQSSGATSSTSGSATSSNSIVKAAFGDLSSQKPTTTDENSSSRPGRYGRVRVTPDITNNALFIEASPQTYRIVERAIREMDRFPTQVNIEVTIAEVTLSDELNYGVQVFLTKGKFSAGLGGLQGVPLQTTYPGLNLLQGALSNPQIVLDALSRLTSVRVLSSPSLVVTDRQPAVLQVGDQVPILTRQAQSVDNVNAPVVNSVDLKDTGIILNVLPRVNANGMVTLNVEQQISSVAGSNGSNTSTVSLTPTISQRRVRSTISVSSGQTVLLAGLITDNNNTTRSGVPGLTQVKFLNDLLASHDTTSSRTELIIFIKPQIIGGPEDAQHVSEEFRERMQSIETGVAGNRGRW